MLDKIKKAIILWICNYILRGVHFFSIKRALLNSCKGISIGKGSCIVTPIHMPLVSELVVGTECWLNRDFTIEGNGKVFIGNNCDLGPTVTMTTGSHKIGDERRRAGEGFCGTINVENGCWLGNRCVILPDCTIGKSSVVAAGAIVTKNISENTLVGGCPAKIIRKL